MYRRRGSATGNFFRGIKLGIRGFEVPREFGLEVDDLSVCRCLTFLTLMVSFGALAGTKIFVFTSIGAKEEALWRKSMLKLGAGPVDQIIYIWTDKGRVSAKGGGLRV